MYSDRYDDIPIKSSYDLPIASCHLWRHKAGTSPKLGDFPAMSSGKHQDMGHNRNIDGCSWTITMKTGGSIITYPDQ